jgi:hypothetical protein
MRTGWRAAAHGPGDAERCLSTSGTVSTVSVGDRNDHGGRDPDDQQCGRNEFDLVGNEIDAKNECNGRSERADDSTERDLQAMPAVVLCEDRGQHGKPHEGCADDDCQNGVLH